MTAGDRIPDDLTVAWMVGYHRRDDEVKALNDKVVRLKELLERACTIMESPDTRDKEWSELASELRELAAKGGK